jgi:hypothetical protein
MKLNKGVNNMMAPNYIVCPCKNCNERHAHCHSECEKYIEYKNILNEDNEKYKKEKEISIFINNMCANGALNSTRPKSLKRKTDKK